MKTANIAIFLGILGHVLISGPSPLHAQSVSTSITIEGDDRPWNQGVPLTTREDARAIFLEANKLFYLPLYRQAAEKYIAALAKWKHPAFYFNLAITQLNIGQDIEAHENLEQALRHGEEPLGALQFREAKRRLDDLEHQLGRIHITCPTGGAEVIMDGVRLFTGPGSYEGWVQAKSHVIIAQKQEYLSQISQTIVGRGEFKTLDLALLKLRDVERTRWATWKPWVVTAFGATIIAASGAFQARASRNFRIFDHEIQSLDCAKGPNPTCLDHSSESPPPSPYGYLEIAKRDRAISYGGYLAGGTLLATGIVLLYLNRPRLPVHTSNTTAMDGATITPTISEDILGLSIFTYY